jgi:hypothetical protein
VKVEVVKPVDVFYNPVRLLMPLFQRPYVWNKENQWLPLWQDVTRLVEVIHGPNPQATHFLGAIVIQQVPVPLGALPAWSVIDGQQRLTTLQLFLDALHAVLDGRGWSSLAQTVEPLVENPQARWKTPHDRFKLWPTNKDRPGFLSVMEAPTPIDYQAVVQSRLSAAHQFFRDEIVAWIGDGPEADARATALVGTVTERLEIASIRLEATEDAQAIFETLNARGTPLTAADLIKNFVFQRFDADSAEAEQAYHDYWEDFETPFWEAEVQTGRVRYSRSSLFLYHWLTARTREDFPAREVFAQFKHYVTTKHPDVTTLLPQLKAAADKYRAIIEGSQKVSGELSRVELFAYRVSTLDSELARPLLIWLDEPEQKAVPAADREGILDILESWFVRRALVKTPSAGSNRLMVDLLAHLAGADSQALPAALETFLTGLHSPAVGYWPDDGEVRAALTDTTAYWRYLRGRLRMVLEALEDRRRGYPVGSQLTMGPIIRGKATIEHIMPQNWSKNWPADLDDAEQAERGQLIQSLGNLTLVTQALNSKLSNEAWPVKRAALQKVGDVLLTNEVVNSAPEEWDEESIRVRTRKLIEEIIAVWPVPEGHTGSSTPGRAAAIVTRADVDIASLVDAGWLTAGQRLIKNANAHREVAVDLEVVIAQDGRIFLGDTPFTTPSGAGMHVLGKPVNGWWFWSTESGATLAEVRSEYLMSIGEADAEVVDEVPDELEHSSELDEVGA